MRSAAFVFVWREQTIVWWEQTIVWWGQTIVWWEQTIVWWGQTIVWWEQTMAREEKNSSIAAVVAQFVVPQSRFIKVRKKIVREKETRTRGAANPLRKRALQASKKQKKSATTSRKFVGKACDRQPYTIIYKRYGSKKRRSGARH